MQTFIATPLKITLFCLLAALLPMTALAEESSGGSETGPDEAHTWDLSALYPSVEAWDEARLEVRSRLDQLRAYEGRLGEGGETLFLAFETRYALMREISRVYSFASNAFNADTGDAAKYERQQQVQSLYSDFQQANSFFAPEIIALGEERIGAFVDAYPALETYRFILDDILRNAPHTLGAEAENVLSASNRVTSKFDGVRSLLVNADIDWPEIELSTGEKVTLNAQGYSFHRQAPNRDDRRAVFDHFWSKYGEYSRTLGAVLSGEVESNVYFASQRGHESALEWALSGDNIPPAVYHTLIEETNRGLPVLHRYFKLRGRILGVEQPEYIDIYPELIQLDKRYTLEDAKRLTLASLEPLGPDYLEKLEIGFSQRWMDVYPREGKRSGAYMSGFAYDVHPYLLLNHQDDFNSLSTFTHEWGHAVHTLLARESQPYHLHDYSIFTAEIASISNEVLLQDYLLEQVQSREERLFYLGQVLEAIRGTFFRQAMFAEFELAIHRAVEEGEALSGDKLTGLYLNLLKKYHGHDEGVLTIDEDYAVEWAYIPHFYYDFYVYQYATSIAGGTYLAEKILEGGEQEREQYLDLLRAGGSGYPYQLLKDAGIDLASPEPYRALVDRMSEVLDEVEALLEEQA